MIATDHRTPSRPTSVRERQDPLIARYAVAPDDAAITDRAKAARGVETDPFHDWCREPGQVRDGSCAGAG